MIISPIRGYSYEFVFGSNLRVMKDVVLGNTENIVGHFRVQNILELCVGVTGKRKRP